MICCKSSNLLFGRDGNLLGIVNKVCPPPTESAVGDDGMLAVCHELHVPETLLSFVPIYKVHLVMVIV